MEVSLPLSLSFSPGFFISGPLLVDGTRCLVLLWIFEDSWYRRISSFQWKILGRIIVPIREFGNFITQYFK